MSNNKNTAARLMRLSTCAALIATLGSTYAATAGSKDPDHFEFDATLDAPFRSAEASGARRVAMRFDYPGAKYMQTVAWKLELIAPNGQVVERWNNEAAYLGRPLTVEVPWAGRTGAYAALADGIYQLKLSATVADPVLASTIASDKQERITRMLAMARGHDLKIQRWDIQLGNPAKPAMPRFNPLRVGNKANRMQAMAAPATNALPYTVYYADLHSQTNDSDGGGAIGACSSSQPAQTGQYGPADAFPYGQNAGLDILMTSEHNHYFDGSSSTNASGSASVARSRYQAGLTTAANYNAAHPGFLAVYGMEWGVISNGGHLNIFNSNELFSWEYNSSNELFGDRFTAKSDYAALYSVMKQRGLIGQFNHPDTSGQFLINGTSLGYSADGDEVMVLAEVMNTSAFSSNTTETETGRSNFEDAFNLMLERGYHVAPASNQDNHCANWGTAYTNRTAVLIPTGTALSQASFIDALRARRVFATLDKNAQLILTANTHLMGERFSNAGPLTLSANYASTNGRSAQQVQLFEGVPGRNGTVSVLASQAVTSITPTTGEHFYYAKVTQDDGKVLWSAPVWVSQAGGGNGGGDTIAPVVGASETGNGGSISLNATASDNVAVSRVDFLVDGVLKGSKTTTPYSLALDSTTLSNGSHTLIAKAYDAVGNVGQSNSVGFNISNTSSDTTAPVVSASVAGSSGTITLSANASDNVGVSRVDFQVDGVTKASDSSTPYSVTFDSTTLANGGHSLVAQAADAAGNIGSSPSVAFSVNNATGGSSFSESESNGSIASANVVARTVASIKGTMGNTTDKDYFKLSLNPGETVRIDMTGPSSTDYDLYLVNGSDTSLASSESGTSTESLSYTNGASSQTVYAKVISYSGSSTSQQYTLNLTYGAASSGTQLVQNGSFESGSGNWTASNTGLINSSATQASHAGSWKAWLNGRGSAQTDTLYQQLTIPAGASNATLSFWLKVVSDETASKAYDTLKVQLRSSTGAVLSTLATYSNLDKGSSYVQRSFDIGAYKGQTVQVYFEGNEGSQIATGFALDDISLISR